MTQELLTTFERELSEVALRPGDEGTFEIKAEVPGFTEKEPPDRALGHSDR